jgi:hypothetical protein
MEFLQKLVFATLSSKTTFIIMEMTVPLHRPETRNEYKARLRATISWDSRYGEHQRVNILLFTDAA